MVRPRFLCLAIALLTLLLFLPAGRFGFLLYDDPQYITENHIVQAGLTWTGLDWAFTTFHASNWHPLTWLSHMLDCEVLGLDAGAHHLVNVALHALSAALLLVVLLRLTGALWPSAFVAALFAWHPLRVESVVWLSERKDVLSALFWMLTLWAYLRYVEESKVQTPKPKVTSGTKRGFLRHPPLRYYLLALGFFALGLLSKPMIVTLPFALLLLDWWPLGRVRAQGAGTATASASRGKLWDKLVLEKEPFLVLAAASCVVTLLAQRTEAMVALDPYPLSVRAGNALVAYSRYLFKTFWPADLAVLYPLPTQVNWLAALGSAVLLALITSGAWMARRNRPHLLVGWLWFLGTLVPVIGLVQVGGQAMADRYTYIPSIGLFFAIAFEGHYWLTRLGLPQFAPAVASALLLAACAVVSLMQTRYWKDDESLFTHAIAVTGDNSTAHLNLGVAVENQGRREDALREYQEALRLNPNLAQGHNNLANLLGELGRAEEALSHYREALRLRPGAELAHINLAGQLTGMGQFEEAMFQYSAAVGLQPDDPRPHFLMGKLLLRQGQNADAIAQFLEALGLDANDLKSLTYLARVLASDENPGNRDGKQAVALAEKATSVSGGNNPFVLDTLAMAYAEAGRFNEAKQTANRAMEFARTLGDTNAVVTLEVHLRMYEAGRPCHESLTNGLAGQISGK